MRAFLVVVFLGVLLGAEVSAVAAESDAPKAGEEAATSEWRHKVHGHLVKHFVRSRKKLRAPYKVLGIPAVAGKVVIVQFTLERDGRIIESSIDSGSGYPIIDRVALDVVRQANPFPPAPPQFPDKQGHFKQPVTFSDRDPPKMRM